MPSRLRKALRTITPDAKYMWRVQVDWDGELTVAGDPIPDDLREDKIKLATMLAARYVIIDRSESTADAVVASDTAEEGASGTGEVSGWRSLGYNEKDKLARGNGYTGNRMKGVDLDIWLEANLPKE